MPEFKPSTLLSRMAKEGRAFLKVNPSLDDAMLHITQKYEGGTEEEFAILEGYLRSYLIELNHEIH